MGDASTEVRLLTPMLPGAIAVIRLSGPNALPLLDRVFQPAGLRRPATLGSTELCYGRLIDAGETLDDVVVAGVGPNGTGFDISAHGGVRVVQRIVTLLERMGAVRTASQRITDDAWPAANTIEREIDALLSHARTPQVAMWLAAQRERLPAALHGVAAQFAAGETTDALAELAAMVDRYSTARRLLDGITVTVAGPVNAGKSTLINGLAGREHSIATDQPGTTRDWVTAYTSIDGVQVELIDTAGVRVVDDRMEQAAMQRGLRRAEAADVVLWVLDGGVPLPDPTIWLDTIKGFPACRIAVINKSDAELVVRPHDLPADFAARTVVVSALMGRGLETLREAILDTIGLSAWSPGAACLLTARQWDAAAGVLSILPDQPDTAARIVRRELLGSGSDGGSA